MPLDAHNAAINALINPEAIVIALDKLGDSLTLAIGQVLRYPNTIHDHLSAALNAS